MRRAIGKPRRLMSPFLRRWLPGQAALRLARRLGGSLGDLLTFLGLPVPPALARPVAPSSSDISGLLALLARPGCPVCRRAEEDVQRMFFWFLVESYGEPPWIERLCDAGGFCPQHFWALARTGARYQLSYVAQYLAEHDLRLLGEVAARLDRGRPPSAALAALKRRAPCPACQTRQESATRAIEVLLRALADERVRARWQGCSGLCWPHLQRAVATAPRAVLGELVAVERARLAALLAEEASDFEARAARLLAGE